MNPLNLKPSMNFEPPSDFTPDKGGGKSSWKKIFGIGCGVVFLAIAIAIGVGAFKVASCCGDVGNLAQKSQAVSQNVMQFASLVQKGQFKQAHGALSPTYASSMTSSKFEAMLEPHRALLSKSVPMLVNVEPQMVPGTQENLDAVRNIQSYNVTLRFYSSQFPETLHMVVTASTVGEVKEGQPVTTQINHVGAQLRAVKIAQERPAVAAESLYNDLQLRGPLGVFPTLSPLYRKNSTPEQFQAFTQEHPNLTKGLTPEVVFVDYSPNTTPPGSAATVILKLDGSIAYRFDMVRAFPSWQVAAITPHTLPKSTTTPGPVVPATPEPKGDAATPNSKDSK